MQANGTSILVDASKYIKELKDKVEAASSSQADTDTSSAFGSGSAMPATVRNVVTLLTNIRSSEPLDDDGYCHHHI